MKEKHVLKSFVRKKKCQCEVAIYTCPRSTVLPTKLETDELRLRKTYINSVVPCRNFE